MTTGIICEYNPMHRGHEEMIKKLRAGGTDTVVCLMSGSFVQRGEPAIADKYGRAAAAVRSGADVVLELPFPWSCGSARYFAAAGIYILNALGVKNIAFGSECADAAMLRAAAEAAPEGIRTDPAATGAAAGYFAALNERLGGASRLMPNDILGVEYCKALLQSGSTIAPLAILRKVVGHNGGAAKGFASASHIRELLTNGEDASAYLMAESAAIYARECAAGRAPVTMQNAERAVLSRLRAMCEEDFARYDSGNEGLYRRFYDAARTAASVDKLLFAVKTKRYAYARLRRMLLAAYLDVTAADVPPEIPYLRVLACNERGRKLLKTIKKTGSAPVLTKSADVRALSEEAQKLFALTARAADQYVLAYPELRAARGSSAWTEGPVIV